MLRAAPLAATAQALRTDQLPLRDYIQATCDHIDAFEPRLQALLPEPDRRARLLAEASALQERYPRPEARPPLYGVLFGVKDILHVDGFPTRAGSSLPPALLTGPQATCVTRLREAGALLVGKTVTTEFAYFEPGPTRNPHNLAHTPGGSSSGSAAAVAAGFCSLALGTQTIGSVIRPAAFCGIIGFKPGFGRIPTTGLIYCSPSVDTIGFFAQDRAGIALAASILCDDWRPVTPATQPTLGVIDGSYLTQATPEALAAFEQQLALLKQQGYTIRRLDAAPDFAEVYQQHTRMVQAEIAQVHAVWFAEYEPLYRPRTAQAIRDGLRVSAEALAAARASRARFRHALESLMAQYNIDLWLSPAALGPAPEGLSTTGDPAMNLPWTHAGLPAITLPAGRAANGLPLGLQIASAWQNDERLIAWAEPLARVLAQGSNPMVSRRES